MELVEFVGQSSVGVYLISIWRLNTVYSWFDSVSFSMNITWLDQICKFKSWTTVLMALFGPFYPMITYPMFISDVAELNSIIIIDVEGMMMTFIPFFGDCCEYLCSSFSTSATVVFRFSEEVPSISIIVISLERSCFSALTKLIVPSKLRTISHVYSSPLNCIVTLVSVFTLRIIPLAFHLVLQRRFVDMVLLLLKIVERAEMSIVQITVTFIRSLLTNSELNTPGFGYTGSIASVLCELLIVVL